MGFKRRPDSQYEYAQKHIQSVLPGCGPPVNSKFKNIDFVDTGIANVLHDLPFSQNSH
jgi:hypothetical protein